MPSPSVSLAAWNIVGSAELNGLDAAGCAGSEPMETPPLERKLAAILAADVEGYDRVAAGAKGLRVPAPRACPDP